MIPVFLCRVKSLSELLEEKEKEYKQHIEDKDMEVERARKSSVEDREAKEIMTKKYEAIQAELVKMEVRNRQAVDLVNNRREFEPNERGIDVDDHMFLLIRLTELQTV